MTYEQKLKYIRELRWFVLWIKEKWNVDKVPAWHRVAVMSHARHLATGPHHTYEEE